MPTFTVAELALHVDAEVQGDSGREIRGVAPLGDADAAHVSFLEKESLRRIALASPPGALLLRPGLELELDDTSLLRVDHPQASFARIIRLFHPLPEHRPGLHPTAVVGAGAELGEAVRLEAHAVVEAGARIGAGATIGPGAFVGAGVSIGRETRVGHAASVLAGSVLGDRVIVHEGARIGTEGYGYSMIPGHARKIPQIGRCLIGDDVEIGANCTIDRGALGDTSIGARTKLDNLVHVGHNVEIGEDCMIVAQVGIAGSTKVGRGVALAGQAGLAGHLTIGDGARIGARAAVFKSVPAGATYSGSPARPHRTALRASAAALRLPAALDRLRALERRLAADERGPPTGGAEGVGGDPVENEPAE